MLQINTTDRQANLHFMPFFQVVVSRFSNTEQFKESSEYESEYEYA